MSVSVMAMLIPFFAIAAGIGTLLTWLVLWHRHKARELEMRHQERMAAIGKGLGLPDSPPAYEDPLPPPSNGYGKPASRYLLRGLIWLGVGLAVSLGRADPFDSGLGPWGWIAVAIGVSYLVYYTVEHRRLAEPPRQRNGSGPVPGAPPAGGPPPPRNDERL